MPASESVHHRRDRSCLADLLFSQVHGLFQKASTFNTRRIGHIYFRVPIGPTRACSCTTTAMNAVRTP